MALSKFQSFVAILVLLVPIAAKADIDIPPSLSPIFDDLCKEVACGKGRCDIAPGSPFNFKCECDDGWKRTLHDDDDNLQFLPCIIPNCSVDYSCMPSAPPLPSLVPPPLNLSFFDPCNWIYCGEGTCTTNTTHTRTHTCQCNAGYSNLLNISTLPCYKDYDGTSFSYVIGAPNGPQNWSNLNPNWTLCGTGRSQSPINIFSFLSMLSPSLGDLNTQYRPAPARIVKGEHEIEVQWIGDAGGITINGTEFKLVEFHWHIPSEHEINGIRYDMELHIVHYSSEQDVAVVGILYKLGSPDPFLKQIAPFLGSATGNGSDIGAVDPSSIELKGREYYRYNGSLTTPPCSENVTWTIFKKVKTVSLRQIMALRNAVDDVNTGNARPIQPLNGRPVYLFRPTPFFIFW